MFSTVRIEGFRGLRELEMSGLGRVNLLVGKNNCGKTSVLEALYLLLRGGDRTSLVTPLTARGERVQALGLAAFGAGDDLSVDISRLFFAQESDEPKFRIVAENSVASSALDVSWISEGDAVIRINADGRESEYSLASGKGLAVGGHTKLNLTPPARVAFVTTATFSAGELIELWNDIVLTPDEPLVVKAIQYVEPDVERIAALSWPGRLRRGGFAVKLKGVEHPVPIGSLGEGIWRMLAIVIALTQSRGGALLIDEIDTGLHYSVLSKMWSLLYQAAVDMDVQVFATTHSQDCIRSFAEIAERSNEPASVSIQRIVQGKPKTVAYTPEEVAVLANQDIEVR